MTRGSRARTAVCTLTSRVWRRETGQPTSTQTSVKVRCDFELIFKLFLWFFEGLFRVFRSVVECPPLPSVGNATRIGSRSSFGSVVVFTCPRGYYMGRSSEATFEGGRVSTATVHCQADAQWSHVPDNCYCKLALPP